MYIVNTEITLRWLLAPTDSPLTASDYDIGVIPAHLDGTYANAEVVNFTAPSETRSGSLEYIFTPLSPGLWKITLSTGLGGTYQILEVNRFWLFLEAPTTQGSLSAPGHLSRASEEVTP